MNVELLDVRAAAMMTGVSPRTFWRLVQTGEAPAGVRVRGCRRWRRAELASWIESLPEIGQAAGQ